MKFSCGGDRAKLPRKSMHALRHLHISLVANTVSPTIAQAQAGHSNLRTTSRYVHEQRGLRKTEMAKVRFAG